MGGVRHHVCKDLPKGPAKKEGTDEGECMCGIAGISYEKKRISLGRLKTMAEVMVHRGPDEEGLYLSRNGRMGLVHRRLKVIDLEGGHQPITNEDGSKVLVFNGEIYNFKRYART